MDENILNEYLLSVPKTGRGRKTLEKISNSAETLFGSKGYTNTSINDIALGANVAPGTFYIYFKDKISVFRYLIQKLELLLRRELSEAIKNLETRYEQEHDGFKTFFYFLSRHKGLFKIIWEAQFVDPELFKNYYETIAEAYAKRIVGAQSTGEMRSDLDSQVVAYSFLGIANFIGLKWIIFDDKSVPEESLDDLMKLINSGVFSSNRDNN